MKGLRNSLCRGTDCVATVIYSINPRQPTPISDIRERANPTFEEFSSTTPSLISSYCDNSTMVSTDDDLSPPPTLEEMLARLDEEAEAEEEERSYQCRYQGLRAPPYGRNVSQNCRRMSSVNNSEILKAARNALNQYPRFSLDGRDAMHRPSVDFDSNPIMLHKGQRPGVDLPRKSFTNLENQYQYSSSGDVQRFKKPGLLARLMGLETMPVTSPSNKVMLPLKSSANISSAKGSQNTQIKTNDRRFMQAQQYSKGNSKQSRLGFEHHRRSFSICDQIREDISWLSLAEKSAMRKTAGVGAVQFSSCSSNQSEKQQSSCSMKAPEPMKYSIKMKEKKGRTCKHGVQK